jgi:hypothetical protein
MRDAFDGGIKGSVSLDFLATLSQGVDKLSNGRYLVYEPTHDEYVKLGGITCRCMQVAYLARRDNVTGEKRPFALHTEGDTDLFGHWAN